MNIGEAIGDGIEYGVAGVLDFFGADKAAENIRRDIAIDKVGEMNKWFYENTEVGKHINEQSVLKYDSKIAQGIEGATEFVGKIAIATAIEVFSGGTATPLLFALGMAEGMGNAAESAYQNALSQDPNADLTLSFMGNLGIIGSGALDGLSWVMNGKLGEGFLEIGKSVTELGVKEVVPNIYKAIFNKEAILKSLKNPLSLLGNVGGSLMESGGQIGLIVSKISNGEPITAKDWAKLVGTVAFYFGLNVIQDVGTDYVIGFKELKAKSFNDFVNGSPKNPHTAEAIQRNAELTQSISNKSNF